MARIQSGNKPVFLLSFTFSFEDFIIAFFVAGPNNTLPIYIFASIRRGITPEINAIGAVVSIHSEGRREEATVADEPLFDPTMARLRDIAPAAAR